MLETISIFIHLGYLSLYLIYLKFLNQLSKEKIIFILLLVYFFLPGRFSTLQVFDIYFSKIYILIFLFPLFINEIINLFKNLKNKKNINFTVFLIFVPAAYLMLFFLKSKTLANLGFNLHFKNYFLDLLNTVIFLIFIFNDKKLNLKQMSKYVEKFIFIASIFLIFELFVFLLFKIKNINFYDTNGAFNSIFFPSFFVTSLFTGIAILFAIYNFVKYKKYWNLPIIFLLSSIIIFNIESRAIILSLAISSLILIFVLFKKNIVMRFSIIFLFLFISKISFNFDQCTYLESNFFKTLKNFQINPKNLCDYESSYYRLGLLHREIDVILSNLPFGVGPGVGKFYYNDIDTLNYLYPDKINGNKLREIYADILDVHFENTQIYPPQASNLFTDVLMSYGIFIIIFIFYFFKFVSKTYGISKNNFMNIYSIGILFIFLNFIFNSTSGLIMLQILMTLLALTYRSEKDVQKI